MPTFQEQFQQYLSNSYYPNDPTLNQGGEPNVVEPINTFDVSPELKKKLKKQRKTISPIRQYENDTLQFDETTGTGQFDFSDPFKLFNIAAQGITGFANANNDAKNRRLEEQMYLQSIMPKPSFNYNEDGLNNIPMYKGGGQNPAKVYTDRKQFEQAQRMYNDSLNLYLEYKDIYNRRNDSKEFEEKNKHLVKNNIKAYEKPFLDYSKEVDAFNKVKSKIKPISRVQLMPELYDDFSVNKYKKPVQPVVYQSHPIQKMRRINPQQLGLNSNINIQGQPIPFPEMNLPQQKGTPVYGPGNTIVGYSDNMNFKPAYQYTGAPNNPVNLQDKELLNNPEALRKYMLSKDNYKFTQEEFKAGGKNETKQAAAWRILREGKANGKKLTPAQKKFFGAMAHAKYPNGGENDWHHNVDNIDFPGYGMTPLDPKNSKYFQDETFVGPPNYPANFQGVNNPQWSFSPVRVDYNQKYIPYKQYPNTTAPARQHKLKKEVNIVDSLINDVITIGSTEPQVQPITGQKIFLDPNNPTMAAPQNDIWNNPNGSDQLPVEPYERKGTGDVKSWFATGGYNEGEEIDLTEEQIKEMQKAGFRFEIL